MRHPPVDSPALQALDQWTRFTSEDLARSLDRRSFLKRAGTRAFGFFIALAAGQVGFTWRRAKAAPAPAAVAQATPNCAPPGPYCNYEGGSPPSPDSCYGGHCYRHMYQGHILACWEDYSYYQAGCWTSPGAGGYWTCCDCKCGTPTLTTCGCAQFSGSPRPLPTGGSKSRT